MKEFNDVLTALLHAKLAYNEAMEDGEFDWNDPLKFIPVVEPIMEAVKGVEKIPDELLKAGAPDIEDMAYRLGILLGLDKLGMAELEEVLLLANPIKNYIIKKIGNK